MFNSKYIPSILLVSSLILVSCRTNSSIDTQKASVKATTTNKDITTSPPKATTASYRYPIPLHSYRIEAKGDTIIFENGSPIPALSTFYKNQLLADECTLDSESGSSMEALVIVFKNCGKAESLRIIIYAHPKNSGSVVSITPER